MSLAIIKIIIKNKKTMNTLQSAKLAQGLNRSYGRHGSKFKGL